MMEAGTEKPARFDVVIVHSFSRFFRDHFELKFYVRKLAKNGVKLVSMTQELGDAPMHVNRRPSKQGQSSNSAQRCHERLPGRAISTTLSGWRATRLERPRSLPPSARREGRRWFLWRLAPVLSSLSAGS